MCNSFFKGCCQSGKCTWTIITRTLLVVGGINWGLVGIGMLVSSGMYSWNVINVIFGSVPVLEAVVYILVGLAAVYSLWGCHCSKCKSCVCTDCAPENKSATSM